MAYVSADSHVIVEDGGRTVTLVTDTGEIPLVADTAQDMWSLIVEADVKLNREIQQPN
jgi:hypothetical protein